MIRLLMFLLLLATTTSNGSCFEFSNSFYSRSIRLYNVVQRPTAYPRLILTADDVDDFYAVCELQDIDLSWARHFVWTRLECRGKKIIVASEDLKNSVIFIRHDLSPEEIEANEGRTDHLWIEIATVKLVKKDFTPKESLRDWHISLEHPLDYPTLCHCPEIDGPIKYIDYLSTKGIIITFANGRSVAMNLLEIGEDAFGHPRLRWCANSFGITLTAEDPKIQRNYRYMHVEKERLLDEIFKSEHIISPQDLFLGAYQNCRCVVINHKKVGPTEFTKIAIEGPRDSIYIFSTNTADKRFVLESTIMPNFDKDALFINIFLQPWPELFAAGQNWDPFHPSGIAFSIPNDPSNPEARAALKICGSVPRRDTMGCVLLPTGSICNRTNG